MNKLKKLWKDKKKKPEPEFLKPLTKKEVKILKAFNKQTEQFIAMGDGSNIQTNRDDIYIGMNPNYPIDPDIDLVVFGKPETGGIYDSLIEEIQKEEKERLKHAQEEAGKFIMEIVEKEFPEFKGKFTVEWDKIE